MDCYAQQRQQSKPGAWKVGLEPPPPPPPQKEVEPPQKWAEPPQREPPRVLDEKMCGVLGGGSLTKALSTAFKGVMSQMEFQVRRDGGEKESQRERER
jgi:hypothetical protein